MPSLAELTDQYPQQDNSLPVAQPYTGSNLGPLSAVGEPTGVVGDNPTVAVPAAPVAPVIQPDPNSVGSSGYPVIDKLLGLGGQERYQLWPEKVVRDAISAPHDIIQTNPYPEGSEEASWFEDQRGKNMVPAALNMSALAGTGGLAGTGAELGETLGAGPFLRPALKVGDKIYKAPIKDAENPLGFGAEHSDALPAHLADDFYKKAMSGEDINHYNFGFVNHKGQFLDREKALDYGIEQGLVDPQNGKYRVLTSTMLADSSKPGTAIEAMAKSQPFYSALEHNVNAIQQPKMTGDQWLGTLANKPGVKPEEMDWTGVKDFLKEKGNQPVTKAELQEHLQNNKVEIKEINKSGEEGDWDPASDGPGKYSSYQLPGGENYREKLLTLPGKPEVHDQNLMYYMRKYPQVTKEIKTLDDVALAQKHNAAFKETMKGISPEEVLATARASERPEIQSYKSSHWDEPNILAHVRMNDRMIDGKKSLHLEELQSDMMQTGRDKGFKSGFHPEDFDIKELPDKKGFELRYKGNPDQFGKKENYLINTFKNKGEANAFIRKGEIPERLGNVFSKENMRHGEIPDAPFEKNWHELALKRMIREAAEKGYDSLSWTPGEAQAARYDLSKSVSTVVYKDGKLTAVSPTGQHVINNEIVGKDKLADYIGKEAAEKLLKQEPHNGAHTLQGEQLKIGGEGMKGFYDQIIPKSISKISGEKIKTARINIDPANKARSAEEFNELANEHATNSQGVRERYGSVHYIDISPALRDKALGKGFPLFSSTHIFTPVSHNPFSNEKKK